MNNLRLFCWVVFIITAVLLRGREWYVNHPHNTGYNIVKLELASAEEGSTILKKWNSTLVDTDTVLHYARVDLLIDFLFIIGYVGVLITISNYLMQRQRRLWLNELLRLCLLLAIVAGLLDVIENCVLLFDMYHYRPGTPFYTAMWVAYPKFILIAFILLIWMKSLFTNVPGKRQ